MKRSTESKTLISGENSLHFYIAFKQANPSKWKTLCDHNRNLICSQFLGFLLVHLRLVFTVSFFLAHLPSRSFMISVAHSALFSFEIYSFIRLFFYSSMKFVAIVWRNVHKYLSMSSGFNFTFQFELGRKKRLKIVQHSKPKGALNILSGQVNLIRCLLLLYTSGSRQQLALTFSNVTRESGAHSVAFRPPTLVHAVSKYTKYYDKLSANLHSPGETLHFSTQTHNFVWPLKMKHNATVDDDDDVRAGPEGVAFANW